MSPSFGSSATCWFQRFDFVFTVPQKLMVPAHIHIMAMVVHINIQEVPWSQISVCAGCHFFFDSKY